jgi:hypothetical protein
MGFHLARQSREVHGYDRPRVLRDPFLDLLRIDVAIRPDVSEHGRRPHVENRLHGGAECHWRRNYFITRADFQTR